VNVTHSKIKKSETNFKRETKKKLFVRWTLQIQLGITVTG
jgi:hypothetical protein